MLTPEKRVALVKKIKALLRQTTQAGRTEDEALQAAAQAAKLQAEYNLDLTQTELYEDGFALAKIGWTSEKNQFIEDRISVAIALFTHTRTWVIRPKHFVSKKIDYSLCFCGFKADVIFAEWQLKMLRDYIHRSAMFHGNMTQQLNKRNNSAVYRSFVLGACNRIVERLQAIQNESVVKHDTHNALVVVDKQYAIGKYISSLGLNFQTKALINDTIKDIAAYAAGEEAGDFAGLNRPLDVNAKRSALK